MLYVLFAFLLFACNDYGVNKLNQTKPELVVYPETIDFGHLQSGFESGQLNFVVINAGDEDLVISHPELLSDNDRFSLSTETVDSYTILPGGIVEFEVYYNPITFETNNGLISFTSNDADEDFYELPVSGFGDAPVMTITPEVFNYGQISIGCDNEERITMRNDGNLSLTVSSITQMVTQPNDIIMEFGSLPNVPWELEPTQEIDFLVSYIPSDVSYDESIIRVESNDPLNSVLEVIQYGDGDVEHWVTQTHVQEEIAYLDVIFVIDNSGSMNIFQQELESQIGVFMNVFVSSGADYHLAVITTDEAALIEYNGVKWIDNSYLTPTDWLQTIIGGIGIRGSGTEKGIEMAKNALEGDAGPGRGFLRSSAALIIIYVSDEADHSSGGWNSYTNFFDGIKPDLSLMKHFAVIGDYPSGCVAITTYGSRNIGLGEGYYDMTQRYNGDWYSICASDWGQQIQNLANTVVTRKRFELDEPDPIETTIIVSVNSQQSTDWTYDVGSNAVIFNDNSIPLPNQSVTIEYAVWGCGDE